MFTRTRICLAGLAMVGLSASLALGQGIQNSAHDFSTKSWSGGEVCVVCHTPHGANSDGPPLWNHETTTAVFTLYSSFALDSTPEQPNGPSKTCLSCHDGTVAVDSFGGATGTEFIIPSDHEYIGTDLSDDHPISIVYDTALATTDGELFDPSTEITALGGTIDEDLLIRDRVECGSCHDVHDTLGNEHLLKIDNAASALCFTCHDK